MGVLNIQFSCDLCNKISDELGGLIIGPPDDIGMTLKEHICVECYERDFEFDKQRLTREIDELRNTLMRARLWWATKEHSVNLPIPPWEE